MEKTTQTEYGYDIIWANNKNYGSKIMIFNNETKTNFVFHQKTSKSWFINAGKFKIRWIDTKNGKIFEQIYEEGHVFDIESLKPYSVQCISKNGSISEVNNGIDVEDVYNVLSKDFF
jgi:hypothetical protein